MTTRCSFWLDCDCFDFATPSIPYDTDLTILTGQISSEACRRLDNEYADAGDDGVAWEEEYWRRKMMGGLE